MMLKPAHLLLAMITVVAAPAFAQNVATVNGKPIPAAKLEKYVKMEVANGKKADTPQLREEIKSKLVEIEVLRQEAEKQGYGIRTEVKDAVENARQNITISAMFADWAAKSPTTDAEIKAEYDKYIAQMGDKEYHARHILVATEDEAKAIITKLKGGAKFEELAKQSKDGSANNGGDLGWALPGNYVPEFSKAMVALQKGAITETPVKSQFGFHVIKLEDSRPAPKLETVKTQVAEVVKQRKMQAKRDELMKKAVIK